MGEICGFSLEFVIKGESTKKKRSGNGWQGFESILCSHHMGVRAKCPHKNIISQANFCFVCFVCFQVSGFSRSHQTSNPLDAFSNLAKKSGSLRHVFTSWQNKPKRNRTFSEDSAIEEDHFHSPVKMEESGGSSGLQTCSLYTPTQCNQPATTSDNLRYEAESPDEAALVYAAKAYGFTLLARTPDSVTVRLPSGDDLVFEVLDTLTFDSTRKRMSILVRHPITKEYVLYTKGADYGIMELLGTPYAGMCRWKCIHTLLFQIYLHL